MLEFIKIILFGSSVILTPDPIDIVDDRVELDLEKPISAITSGAALYLDVSAMVPSEVDDVFEARSWADEKFAKRFSSVTLSNSSTGEDLTLWYEGDIAWSRGDVRLMFKPDDGFPVDAKYDRLVLRADVDLHGVRIKWKNYTY